MAITHYYVRATNGADVAGQGTSHATAYKTPQFALDDIGATHGQGADGDQINICATTAEGANTLAAALSIATYGTPTAARPLILRGYTTVANDGGVGEINCGGFPEWASSAYDYIHQFDLELHTFGDNDGVYIDTFNTVARCEVHRGASAPNTKRLIRVNTGSVVTGNYVHDPGAGTAFGIVGGTRCVLNGNFVDMGALHSSPSFGISAESNSFANFNIVLLRAHGYGIYATSTPCIQNNIVFSTVANTEYGIYLNNVTNAMVTSNIVCGFSGAGGVGIYNTGNAFQCGHNAFYNNTVDQVLGNVVLDLGNDVALAADPFVDAANGDFSLTDAAKLLLRSAGWPASYLGGSTDPHITIGAVQYGEAAAGGGSGVIRRAMRMIGA
jgi:hypothetical protein